jgi:hypothetical protein
MAFTLKRGIIEALNIRASEMVRVNIANSKSVSIQEMLDRSESSDKRQRESVSPIVISGKVRFLSEYGFYDVLKPGSPDLESFSSRDDYVFIHCWFNSGSEDNPEGTIRLWLKDAKLLDPRKDDILMISISPKIAKPE